MNYFVLRDGKEYGPYSLADLQRYTGSGEILLTDRARSEGMSNWAPVSQILGNIPASPPPVNYGQVPVYGSPAGAAVPGEAGAYPLPPNLHWGLVLLFALLTCGIFLYVWMFVQAAYVKKLDPQSNGILYYAIGVGLLCGYVALTLPVDTKAFAVLAQIGGGILLLIGHFNLRSSLWTHFNDVERINLDLSGVMTFFFNTIYFQYHFNRIHRWRTTGVLS